MTLCKGVLCWLHIGDLHVGDSAGHNLADLRRLVALAGQLPDGAMGCALLAGDSADDGEPDKVTLVREKGLCATRLGPTRNGRAW